MRHTAVLVVLTLLACAPVASPPVDPEIPLGSPLRSGVIVEITLDHQRCSRNGCTQVITVLHQGGGAGREFSTGTTHDSTKVSSIDSLRFDRLAVRLWGGGFFSPEHPRSGVHPPLAEESWLLTISTRSGETTRQFSPGRGAMPRVPFDIQAVQEVADSLRWTIPK